ncbi:IS30 family transposase [Allofrancisella frigidaquae]|uniref:IS30 family transposase n=1 Tax=Allofrancisella frigidaquae TaxID=1085644 RepID=A0A6M3HXH7_9GAMM|nr:IS30 family transposase [Allofrancisella frigidaquae]QIV94811.1 IS30 family transposase [Allofrancisella frigidaquae]
MAHRHLTLSDRYYIENLLKLGYLEAAIANKIGFSKTAVINELKRNKVGKSYSAEIAHKLYCSRRKSNNHKLTNEVKKLIIALLKKKISLELICGRLQHEGIANLSFKAVYNFIQRHNLKQLLFYKGRRYKYKKEGSSNQGKIKDRVNISQRPKAASDREALYHFEGDTIVGKDHKGAILTMVDRVSRFTILGKAKDRTASSINQILYKASNGNKITTATFDNGKEFAKHKKLSNKTGIKVFFADAYSPWQRGTNENMNRYIRQFIPKGTDFSNISHQYLRKLQIDLNNRPKKCLNYLTPNEVHFGISINIENTI